LKQLFLNLKSGKVSTEEVPTPVIKDGGVLVKNHFSAISAGTELSTLKLASSSYLKKAQMKPDLFKKVLNIAKKQGVLTAYQAAMGTLKKPIPLGYSCAGEVIERSEGVPFEIGDRVACGGNTYAHHSEVIFAPKNLVVKVPDGVSMKDAAYTTIGSIAMQGVRNSRAGLGDNAVVIGLGLIGQITVQILKAAGCRTFGIDIDEAKVELGKKNGMDAGGLGSRSTIVEQVLSFTGGNGADAVIITAATESNEPLVLAGEISRKKGRVVLVGVVGMEIPRDIFFQKELEFVVSCSYGPGRYDPIYEEQGVDYPIGYVRWTEGRNMEAFLDLIADGSIDLSGITTHEFEIGRSPEAYEMITGEKKEPYIGILLKYPLEGKINRKVALKGPKPLEKNRIGIGMIGAGSFATSVLLPSLSKVEGVDLIGLCASTGISSRSAGENFGFEYATTDYKEVLRDDRVDAVIIATRNSLHAPIAIEALESNKHVFVEKPMAIEMKELESLIETHNLYPDRVIQVGFNRRYAPITKRVKDHFNNRQGPMMIMYRINAEHLPDNHWIYEDKEGGSRFKTELCHFIDYCFYMVGSPIKDWHYFPVSHRSMSQKQRMENIQMILRFEDGSTASITYNTISDPSESKELIEVYSENSLVEIKDFRSLRIISNGKVSTYKDRLKTEKGHREELIEFLDNIRKGKDPFEEWIQTTRITLEG